MLSLRRATDQNSGCCRRRHQFLSTLSARRATGTADRTDAIPIFLSTLSLRRATQHRQNNSNRSHNFYPRSPCGERHARMVLPNGAPTISIHALLAESDTAYQGIEAAATSISIHALLAESDSKSAQNSRALLRGRDTFYGIGITILAVIGSFYPFCPCFFHIFWCEGTGNFMIAFPSH